jgi:uncharacterized protein YndB with AHSA1/START domain
MDQISVSTTIARPREEVFEYLADIANHAEFSDHYLIDWHLTREDSYGQGAGARFRMKMPFNRFAWADMTFTEAQRPHRIVARGRGGKYNRISMLGIWTLTPAAGGTTTVEYTFETDAPLPSDRLLEALGGRLWMKRNLVRALRRLRVILEQNRGRGRRATVAAR